MRWLKDTPKPQNRTNFSEKDSALEGSFPKLGPSGQA
jgi:hypothetical protein